MLMYLWHICTSNFSFCVSKPDAASLQASSQLPLPSGKNFILNDARCSNETPAPLPLSLSLPSLHSIHVAVTPPSTSIPLKLVIVVSLGAGVPLLCLVLICFICVMVLYCRLKKSPYKMQNPLYDASPNALSLSLESTESSVIEAPLENFVNFWTLLVVFQCGHAAQFYNADETLCI